MSKIAEKRVNELGYFKDTFNRQEFTANDVFDCGVECYDQAMQDFLDKAIIAYCEVCKMPNCVMQKQKEICPYLSKFRRHLKC